jgi:Helix-turn-helix domain
MSQAERILALLQSRDWVPLPLILDLRIACHSKRIHELRRAGYNIEMRETRSGRVRHTAYRLRPAEQGALFQ